MQFQLFGNTKEVGYTRSLCYQPSSPTTSHQAFAYKSPNKRVELWSCITTIVQAQLLNPRSDNLTSCLLHLMSNLRQILCGRPRAMIAARHRRSETEGEETTHRDNTPQNPLHPRSAIEGLLQAHNK